MRDPREKLRGRDSLAEQLEAARSKGQRVVFTNGCFDLLHVGHLETLLRARQEGDLLVVGVNSDASVQRLKGPERPLVGQEERALLLAALECVDFVVLFDEDTPVATIQALRPQVHVKGGDYRPEDLPEAAAVRAHGGRIVIAPTLPGRSSSRLVEMLRSLR